MSKTCKKNHIFAVNIIKYIKTLNVVSNTCDVMCYEYIDSWKKLKQRSLPSKKTFFSKLNNKYILWNKFNRKTVEEYLELYNMQYGELINMF